MKNRFIIALLLLWHFAAAQTNSWKGTSSTSWETASNWSLNLVPTSTHDVVIGDVAFTGAFQLALTSSSVCKSLVIGVTKIATLTMISSRTLTGYDNITINSSRQL